MFKDRRSIRDLMDELDKFIDEMERDLERMFKGLYQSGEAALSRPWIYGFSVRIGPDGLPVIHTFGDRKLPSEEFREPVYDQVVDEGRGELRIYVELPGVEKEDVELQSAENEVRVSAIRGDRKYRASIELKEAVDPDSTSASYKNGVLEIIFRLKGKANKGYTRIRID